MLKTYLPRQVLKKDPNESELYCEFFNGSILQVLGADEPDSLRGKAFKGVVLDEWAMMKPMVWEEILRPIVTENKGWVWFLFTPKGRNHAFRLWNNANDWSKTGTDWANFFLPVTSSGLIDQVELERAKIEMPEILFKQEFMCEFIEGEGSVFRNIKKCVAGKLSDPVNGARYVIGVDLAKVNDFTVLVCIDQISKRVVAYDRFNEISWRVQKERIAKMAKDYNDALVIMDSTGLGDPILEDLQNAGIAIEGFKFTETSKRSLIERLILAIEQRYILFPDIPEMIAELESFGYELTKTGFRYTAPDGVHDDIVIALGLAVHGVQGNLYSSAEPIKINFDSLLGSGRGGW
jgi:hypothetical protein